MVFNTLRVSKMRGATIKIHIPTRAHTTIKKNIKLQTTKPSTLGGGHNKTLRQLSMVKFIIYVFHSELEQIKKIFKPYTFVHVSIYRSFATIVS